MKIRNLQSLNPDLDSSFEKKKEKQLTIVLCLNPRLKWKIRVHKPHYYV